jgi:hypothetical protein
MMSMLRLLMPLCPRQPIPRTGLLHDIAQGGRPGESLLLQVARRLLPRFLVAIEAIKPPRI